MADEPEKRVEKDLENNFKPVDGVPRDFVREKNIIREEKASLLIHSLLQSKKLEQLFTTNSRCYWKESNILACPVKDHEQLSNGEIGERFGCRAAREISDAVVALGGDIRDRYSDSSRTWCLALIWDWERRPGGKWRRTYKAVDEKPTALRIDPEPGLYECCRYLRQLSLFSIINLLAKGFEYSDNVDRLFHNFNKSMKALYGKFNLSSQKLNNFDFSEAAETSALETLKSKSNSSEKKSDETLLYEFILNFICNGEVFRDVAPDESLTTGYGLDKSSSWKFVYSFTDEDGYITQKVLKLPEFQTKDKVLVPCTRWRWGNIDYYYCLPVPEKQPLYNLYELHNNPDCPVILTDSIEIADLNRGRANTGVVWSGWLVDYDHLDQVDWSPLKNHNAPVYLLVTNHSGMNFADAFESASHISKYLENTVKLVELNYAQVQVKNPPNIEDCENINDFLYHDSSGIECDHIKTLSREDFERKVEEALEWKKRTTDFEPDAEEEVASEDTEEKDATEERTSVFNLVVRPILAQKELTILYGKEETAKTTIAMSICAAVLSDTRKDLIKGKGWTVPRWHRGEGKHAEQGQKTHVFYFNLEPLGTVGKIKDIQRDTFAHYIPKSTKSTGDTAESRLHLVSPPLDWKDGETLDFTNEANQNKILQEIDRFENNNPNSPVRLVVIDHYLALTHDPEHRDDFKDVKPLLHALLQKRNKAVLLLCHSDRGGNTTAGFESKKRYSHTVVQTERRNQQKQSTSHLDQSPLRISFQKMSQSDIPEDDTGFIMRLPKKKPWELVMDEELEKQQQPAQSQDGTQDQQQGESLDPWEKNWRDEAEKIIDEYKEDDIGRDDRADILGYSHAGLGDRLPKKKDSKNNSQNESQNKSSNKSQKKSKNKSNNSSKNKS